MKRELKRLFLFYLSGLLGLFLVLSCLFYFRVWRVNMELVDIMRSIIAGESGIPDAVEIRAVATKALASPYGDHYGAFFCLERYGDYSSVPYLIRALRWQEPPRKRCCGVGATEHCLGALYKITGQKFGYAPDKWDQWWQENEVKFSKDKSTVSP